MRKVEKIMIVFENCETVELTAGDVYSSEVSALKILDIRRDICSVAVNAVRETLECQYAGLVLNPGADRDMPWSEITLFERLLRCRDITYIDIMYEDGTDDYIHVPWCDDLYDNEYQSASMQEGGCLRVEVIAPEFAEKYGSKKTDAT